jgi:hypothetical protein
MIFGEVVSCVSKRLHDEVRWDNSGVLEEASHSYK